LYPEVCEIDKVLLEEMEVVRSVCSLGLNLREENRLKLRQPLQKAYANMKNVELLEIVKEELNVKEVEFVKSEKDFSKNVVFKSEGGNLIALDIKLTNELEEEGLYNDFVRVLQNLRKENGWKVGEEVVVEFASDSKIFEKFEEKVKKEYKVKLVKEKSLEDVKEVSVGNEVVKLRLKV
jgi:hypothetical protein